MKHILLPDNRPRRLVFYLAMEEYVARHIDEKECFFMWQVDPTVIFGRNQVLEAEVNLPYCRSNDIAIFRRKSGGGCVYSDRGNIMLSYIKEGNSVGFIFDSYMRRITFALQKAGIAAQMSGRNDILIDGRKVSGNAFYQLPDRSIVHGTMLFDTNFDHLENAITPSDKKLQSKGVQSVRQRVTNLKEHTSMSVEEFKQYMIDTLCDSERTLTADEVAAIEAIEATYLDEEFILGKNPRYSYCSEVVRCRAGELSVVVELRRRLIESIELKGDFFALRDYADELNSRLKGKSLERTAIQEALNDFDTKQYIKDLTTNQLIDIIFTETIK
ncbi:MAG: lipoate--protein ligase [Bacteroidaceae bacterium]|nr:lipoate--protein ligase [Bacteroidaceae bacterium]